MNGPGVILQLVAARVRRRPGRWLLMVGGLALVAGLGGSVAALGTITADQSARRVLGSLPTLGRVVRVSWPGDATPAALRRADFVLARLGVGPRTQVTLLNPVRLGGIVVRPVGVDPLPSWTDRAAPKRCRAIDCPMLLASGRLPLRVLQAPGVRIRVLGSVRLRSAAPLGFMPGQPAGGPPVLLTGDPAGLEALPGLGGIYRTHSRLALLPVGSLQAWQLGGTERALRRAQASLLLAPGGYSLSAPFTALEQARSDAAIAPKRLLLAAGGAVAAFVLFLVLAVDGLARDLDEELGRLRSAGATEPQCVLLVTAEAGLLSGLAIVAGVCVAVLTAVLIAGGAGLPVSGVLRHSLLTGRGAVAVLAGMCLSTVLVALLVLVRVRRLGEVLALAALAGLALALTRGGGAEEPLAVLLAPLSCLAAGVLVFRLASLVMPFAERGARSGPVSLRLALISLARAPRGPALAIAFISLSTGLGGFALAYRATLERSNADQAAAQVPLDARIAPGSDFASPLELRPLAAWRSLVRGTVFPVRRTLASYVSGDSSATIPALGVPASVLPLMHGWRAADGSASLAVLAHRLAPQGLVVRAGPTLSPRVRTLSLRAQAYGLGVSVTADLRDPAGHVRRVALGMASTHGGVLSTRVRVRQGTQLEGLELAEPAGLQITNGHQNGENPAAQTRFAGLVRIGDLALGPSRAVPIGGWRGVGAATVLRRLGGGLVLRFASTGQIGLLRPTQPSDRQPIPVLADPGTLAVAGHAGRLALAVDSVPLTVRIVGTLRRFPTLPAGSGGLIVADQSSLSAALDAGAPGQGLPDELWVRSSDLRPLRAALSREPLRQLSASLRDSIRRRLASAPLARALERTLIAAGGVYGALALIGLLVVLLGTARDQRVELDLAAAGLGPSALRRELRLRAAVAAVLGVLGGLGITAVLVALAVAAVRASGSVASPVPALVAVAPWPQLFVLAVGAAVVLAVGAWVASAAAIHEGAR